MAAEVDLEEIIEALELAQDESFAFLDVETGEVHSFMQDEYELAEEEKTDVDDLPEWQREIVEDAKRVHEQEGTRYLALPDKFHVHDWAIMDRFSRSIEDSGISEELRNGIRGVGAFRMFRHLLDQYGLWDSWNKFKRAELQQTAIDWCEEHGMAYRETKPPKEKARE